MQRLGIGLLFVLLAAGCATPQPPRAVLEYGGQQGGIQVFVLPADARVSVDGEYMGRVTDFQGDNVLWLDRGLHAVEVSREGYHTLFRQVQTTLGLVEILVYTLQPNQEIR
jgi:hypothetical protein